MALQKERYNVDDVLRRLEDEFDMPHDGADSEFNSSDEVLEFDDQINDSSNINDAPHDSELTEDQHEDRDIEPKKKRGRKSVQSDDINPEWSKTKCDVTRGKFTQKVGLSLTIGWNRSAIDFFLLLLQML